MKEKYTNSLINEKSPYLLQHAHNPVNWQPWGKAAFKMAEEKDKPVFLSIGYATCHWCHVMEHESFEDEQVAKLLNDNFICIKVDREERPDIDEIYMTVCQMMTGGGGWPLTVLLTPDRKPFFAGTYFPKNSVHGRTGLTELIPKVMEVWNTRRDDVRKSSDDIANSLQGSITTMDGPVVEDQHFVQCFNELRTSYDKYKGGFGSAPKFPIPHNMLFLMRYFKKHNDEKALEMVEKTLLEMRKGGIFDQVGFGFHRYSTDSRWLLPHFEKMLYDQAMMLNVLSEAYQISKKDYYKNIALEILEYLKRDLKSPEGAFYSAEDADSEGVEGKFYVWDKKELEKAGLSYEKILKFYNIRNDGNFSDESTGHQTGQNILHSDFLPEEFADKELTDRNNFKNELEKFRVKLFNIRKERVRPLLDDKILTDWNGLAIAALAKAGNIFKDETFTREAISAAEFIINRMMQKTAGKFELLHRYRDGDAGIRGMISDYAFLSWGLIELYMSTFEVRYLKIAIGLVENVIANFFDEDNGGFFSATAEAEDLIARKKELYDGAIPSGNSVMMLVLSQLSKITANKIFREYAGKQARAFGHKVSSFPSGYTFFLSGLEMLGSNSSELVISGNIDNPATIKLLETAKDLYNPNMVIIHRPEGFNPEISSIAPFTASQLPINGQPAAYLCRNYTCNKPVTNPDELKDMLGQDERYDPSDD